MKKDKPTLAFEELMMQMEVISKEQQLEYLGGDNSTGDNPMYASTGSNGAISQWLSQALGTNVTSNVDSYGNWTISFGGNTFPLAFQLDEVQITASGHMSSSGHTYYNNWDEIFGSSTWYSTGYGTYNGGGSSYSNNTGSYTTPGTWGTPGTISNNLTTLLDDIWNGPSMRALVPDIISINISANFVPGFGSGQTLGINLITRGDASLSLTMTSAIGAGLHADMSANASVGYFVGDGYASLSSYLGQGYDLALDLEAVGVGGWTSTNNGIPKWIGGSVGVGPGIGGSVGSTETFLLYVNGQPLIWDF
ncbi:hypothetical protein H9X96_22295 [Pedobacter sp. N36a]|uniref:hypothetical protein n=1 Tax=Pedobacter sp. N36a TaxID=2767996 RepID=UPI0016576540|nr:hypothetical protein [Pedobacter sp. N36a]MBC8988484.1 hypothetical protein [Pedobacter sp. N36a]